MSAPTAAAGTVLALDFGGTRLKSGVVGLGANEVEALHATKVDGRQPLELLLHTASEIAAGRTLAAVGLSLPGLVDGGRLLSLAGKHHGLEGVDLASALSDRLGAPAVVINDALAHAIGESTFGAARGHSRVVVVSIGTGVGVGVVEDRLPLGRGPLGGGIIGGQVPIAPTSAGVDSCGRRGTIEALCSAAALVTDSSWHEHLVTALVALAHAHAPSVIVVGGGPLTADGSLLEGVEEQVCQRLYPGYQVAVRRAELGDSAALLGVANLARQSLA